MATLQAAQVGHSIPGRGRLVQRVRPEVSRVRDQETVPGSLRDQEDVDRNREKRKAHRGKNLIK